MSDKSRKNLLRNPEMLVGISAVIIGVCALGVSLYETSLMREEQRAAVLPMLELARSYSLGKPDDADRSQRLQLLAENVGIGPARVVDFRVTVDGTPYKTWGEAVQALVGTNERIRYSQSVIRGRTLPPDRSVTMFTMIDDALPGQVIAEFERFNYEACFCSIFDECWTTSYSSFGQSTPVEACRPGDHSFME